MFAIKDYTKLTHDELMAEQKKDKAGKTAAAFFVGMLIGVAVWAAVSGRFVFTVLLLIAGFVFAYYDNKKRKSLLAEISNREGLVE